MEPVRTIFSWSFFVMNPEVPWVPSGRMSKPRLSRMNLYPENQIYPFFVIRQTSSAPTSVTAMPVGVKTAIKLRKGFTTQMESIGSPVWLKVDRVPSRMELMSIP